ncbi:MAG: DNA polymerase III subunit delta [Elusimicrobia bacterium]|nr:DNA polymerase III subunit delta [Elusimicrobiota bacterium]
MELSAEALLGEWKAGRFRPVYYLLGEESAAKAQALLELKKLFGADDFNRRELDAQAGAQAAIAEALTLPVLAERRLVIVRGPRLPAEARAAFAAYLESPCATTTLVLLCDDRRPDRRDPLAAAAARAGAVCVFAPLDEGTAAERLIARARELGKTLAPRAAEALVAEAGTDWGVLAGELEKAALFVGNAPGIGVEDALQCLGYRKSADPWALERLVQERDLKACLDQLAALFADGKPEDAVFRALAQIRGACLKQLKAKRLLRAGAAPREIETRLRIFYDRGFFARAERVGEERLRRDLRRCLEVEADLKSKSWLDPKLELERLVVELCAA